MQGNGVGRRNGNLIVVQRCGHQRAVDDAVNIDILAGYLQQGTGGDIARFLGNLHGSGGGGDLQQLQRHLLQRAVQADGAVNDHIVLAGDADGSTGIQGIEVPGSVRVNAGFSKVCHGAGGDDNVILRNQIATQFNRILRVDNNVRSVTPGDQIAQYHAMVAGVHDDAP